MEVLFIGGKQDGELKELDLSHGENSVAFPLYGGGSEVYAIKTIQFWEDARREKVGRTFYIAFLDCMTWESAFAELILGYKPLIERFTLEA
ncbi:hypothetical protein [Vibrio harveyi]|uniref:hypothetical protein n=1 Tax=Vibrio harveyi TaxID=669 RepID=UPI0025AFDF20|nr:hypothetical protein [Vibrio harveyi]WJT09248.1 hypothetical protein PH545_24795 [Vibrio harveyi]